METKSSDNYLDSVNCCVDKNKIKKIRKEQGLLLDDIARIANVSRPTAWRLESFKFGIQLCHFLRIAKALGVEPEELLIK